jgi:hypothetical protein
MAKVTSMSWFHRQNPVGGNTDKNSDLVAFKLKFLCLQNERVAKISPLEPKHPSILM